MADEAIIKFAPFSSALDAGFWYELTKKKLEEFCLNDTPVDVSAFYSNNSAIGLPPIANIDYFAFQRETPKGSLPLKGTLINTNTLEDFKIKDKKELLQSIGSKIWESIKEGDALEDPSKLQRLLCLTFADLKKYHYFYWIAFPAITYPNTKKCVEPMKICDYFTPVQVSEFLTSYDSLTPALKTGFLIHVVDDSCKLHKLSDYKLLSDRKDGKILLGFADPSTFEKHPGWPLRNILALVAYHWSTVQNNWDVVCFREFVKEGTRYFQHSIVLSVAFDAVSPPNECPDVVGWEKSKDKLAPRKVDMSKTMDPARLADAAVDLNLKLMRWRLSPDLQLQKIKSTRCLLFGAGTLGCNVARCLMGWGVRKITFIDNAHVSYSNPVRQTLFTFQDCPQGGKLKAEAAAKALMDIFPGVEAEGKLINVPMPGHSIPQSTVDQTRSEVYQIEELIENHDVVFLLMDTRESRWMPSLIAAAKHKLVINAALGFDTYLVMRHGFKGLETSCKTTEPDRLSGLDLGCYFCNDIVAPGNSVQDRTLDQQCTVTRPGVSYMAAALAVELMVSVLQHPLGGMVPTTLTPTDTHSPELCTDLGVVPHQVRGHLYRFQNIILTSKAFDRCTACSSKVIERYLEEGFDFLLKVFNDPHFLEQVTGLSELMTNINMDEVFELSDDESI